MSARAAVGVPALDLARLPDWPRREGPGFAGPLPADDGRPGLAGIERAARSGHRPRGLRPGLGFAMLCQAAMCAALERRADEGTAVSETARCFGDTMDPFARTGLELLHGGPCP